LQIDVRELSWDDKELVLRVLFAKMNGQQQNVDTAVVQATAQSRVQLRSPMPQPVFISEGAYMPLDNVEDAAQFQANFEVDNDVGDDEEY
jgi:inner membrane protein involved in colicin E2 resistance